MFGTRSIGTRATHKTRTTQSRGDRSRPRRTRRNDGFRLGLILAVVLTTAAGSTRLSASPAATDSHLRVDQFGYLPDGAKIAIIGDPAAGFDAGDSFVPGATLELRRDDDDFVVFTGPAVPWNGGTVHAQSGDRAFTFDFTAVETPGSYYVFDPANAVGSGTFDIRDDVYSAVLRDAVRSFYYQRCGMARAQPYAESDWEDTTPCHLATQQDLDCRFVLDPSPATSIDLSGGWHDAGDYNKYVNFADESVHALLDAYTEAPNAFTDDYGLPESGNGIPDLLDEIRYELDWLRRMQTGDGSVLHKVSVTTFAAASPPSADTAFRRYAPPSASATLSACAVFAHAALVFEALGDPASRAYAAILEDAALDAWNWLEANPAAIPSFYDNTGFVSAAAEDSAYEQEANRVVAAVYLFARTGDTAYRAYVDSHHASVHLVQWQYAFEFESLFQDALLYYTTVPGATPGVAAAIQDAYRNGTAAYLDDWIDAVDPYRAPIADGHYVWGSNRVKAQKGSIFANRLVYGIEPVNEGLYRDALAGYVHYLHGVNPLALVYLSNMSDRGAERSVGEFYHAWFADGTDWDDAQSSPFGPAPGFVPGGPNPSFAPDPAYGGPPLEPPQNQPAQKAFRAWNTGWPENSWEVTENSITYQAAYIKLLAKLTNAPAPSGIPSNEDPDAALPEPEHPTSLTLEVFPNPANGTLRVRWDGRGSSGKARIEVIDVLGRVARSYVGIDVTRGDAAKFVDLEDLPAGIYRVRAIAGSRRATRSIVILR